MPLTTRNKLTFKIWSLMLINLLVLAIKLVIFISIQLAVSINQLASYAISSIACFFYVSAIMIQCFEWHLLASMIKY